MNTSPVDAAEVKLGRAREPVLSQVLQFVLHRWPSAVKEEALKLYYARRAELGVTAGCLLWGSRVVIPLQGREDVLKSRPRIVWMMSLARSYVWWPNMDKRVEKR